jgi:hypothetical protein
MGSIISATVGIFRLQAGEDVNGTFPIHYVCINLDAGRATRMPESFTQKYVISVLFRRPGTS